jgi:hypothetical protein
MKRDQAQSIGEQYCCIDLLRAKGAGVMSTASGGVWIGSGSDTGCLGGFPRATFCPFCGSKIVVEPPNDDRAGWSWHTEPHAK